MIKKIILKTTKLFIYLVIIFLDSLIWFFFNLIPSKYAMIIFKRAFWKKLSFNFSKTQTIYFKKLIIYYSKSISKKNLFSNCLSRSTLFMILLELIGIKTKINLGMHLNKNNRKIPHAWLEIRKTGEIITSKIDRCSKITII